MGEGTTYILVVLAAVVGAVGVWLFARATSSRLRAERDSAINSLTHAHAELAAVQSECETWRQRNHDEEVARVREATAAARVPSLEAELREARESASTAATERATFQEQAERVPGLEGELAGCRRELNELTGEVSALRTKLVEQANAHSEKVAALTEIRSEIEKDLKNIAARMQAQGALSSELKSVIENQVAVRTETSKLVNALRAAQKTRGRWGENTLRNVLDLAGLSAHCDFSTEETFERDDEVLRPDVIVRLSGGRNLVIDAKTSVNAYLDAVEAVEDEAREKHLLQHAAQIRNHVRQ